MYLHVLGWRCAMQHKQPIDAVGLNRYHRMARVPHNTSMPIISTQRDLHSRHTVVSSTQASLLTLCTVPCVHLHVQLPQIVHNRLSVAYTPMRSTRQRSQCRCHRRSHCRCSSRHVASTWCWCRSWWVGLNTNLPTRLPRDAAIRVPPHSCPITHPHICWPSTAIVACTCYSQPVIPTLSAECAHSADSARILSSHLTQLIVVVCARMVW